MNKRITRSLLVAITGALVAAAGVQCLLLLGNAFELQGTTAHDTLTYLVRSCRNARMLGIWTLLLGVVISIALPAFWFAARQLSLPWRIYHLSSLTLGSGVLAFYWAAPTLYNAV